MEQPKEPTPEERLYNIIKEGKSGEEPRSDTLLSMPEHFEPFMGPDPNMNQKKARRALAMSAILNTALKSGLRKKILSIASANLLLGVVLAGLLAVFFIRFLSAKPQPADELMKRANTMGITQNEIRPGLFSFDEAEKDFGVFGVRNIFRPWKAPEPVQAGSGPVPSAPGEPQAFTGTLKLSGIYQGDVPEALIEAKEELKTYTVAVGSVLKGYTVKEIKSDSVILSDGSTDRVLR